MVWLPTARLDVLKLAVVVPAEVVSVPWPRLVAPSEKVTTPVGVATAVLPGALTETVAVNVTDWPGVDGLTADVTTVLVLAWPTVSLTEPVLPAKLLARREDAGCGWLPAVTLGV